MFELAEYILKNVKNDSFPLVNLLNKYSFFKDEIYDENNYPLDQLDDGYWSKIFIKIKDERTEDILKKFLCFYIFLTYKIYSRKNDEDSKNLINILKNIFSARELYSNIKSKADSFINTYFDYCIIDRC